MLFKKEEWFYDKLIEQEIEFDELLVLRLNVICDFCNVTLTILNGSLRILKRTNIIL